MIILTRRSYELGFLIFAFCIFEVFFHNHIYPKNTSRKQTLVHKKRSEPQLTTLEKSILPDISESLRAIKYSRYIELTGWKFCPTLEGAHFDALAHIYPLNGSLAEINPTKNMIISLIETQAKETFGSINLLLEEKNVDSLDLRRFSCYFSAEGTNGLVNLSETRFLKEINAKNYFPFLSLEKENVADLTNSYKHFNLDFNIKQDESLFDSFLDDNLNHNNNIVDVNRDKLKKTKKRKLKIAYLILTHEITSFHNIKLLINKLSTKDSIILIHVDLKSTELKISLENLLQERKSLGLLDNVFLQKKSFGVIWGHISVVHAQLEGYFELMDLAEWDYIINLSAYDWPLRTTADIYESLVKHNVTNWIEYWRDPESSAARLSRPHVALSDYKGIVHAFETGLRWWPFSTFHAFKHHQWMILHRSFIEHIRTDTVAMDVLAYMEHTWIPDESFFAIIAVNSPMFKDKVISNSRRYIKFEGGWHPIWITWETRYDFLIGDNPDDGYFFIRKINSSMEPLLLGWLDSKLFNLTPETPCRKDDIGYREKCFKEILQDAAAKSPDNAIILIPVNRGQINAALNLYCSLVRQKMHTQTLFLSFDAEAHIKLVEKGLLSYFNPTKIKGVADAQSWHKGSFSRMMRQKPIMWRMLMDIGVNFWQFDADTVIIKDFRPFINENVDIHLAIDEKDNLDFVLNNKPIPNTCTGMMYFKNSVGTRIFINKIQEKLNRVSWMEDQEAINSILRTEIFSQKPTIILDNFKIPSSFKTNQNINNNSNVNQLTDDGLPKPVIGFLGQMEFISGHYFFNREDWELQQYHDAITIIHGNGREDKESAFRPRGLWLLRNGNTQCPFDYLA
ncbi:Beta-1,3-galactosyl-O-glycosyl-glycoprotein beta-1,6-N-acetylglucosaminyltransferase 4 [Lobulomyces angularis]|nr:Beta-1,3-galactosyl-O-glycosyl-glycoprotein beta-1,6-N-acetylglucosaminyltransferase 4 [Lobulomyces angularis]